MVVVAKCCCCCQLRTGVMVLGWLGLVWSLLSVASTGALYANSEKISYPTPDFPSILNVILPLCIAYDVVNLLVYILLAWGASHGNRFLLLPWLIMDMLAIVVMTLSVLVGGIILCSIDQNNSVTLGLIVLLVGLPICALKIYIWLCVLSCFQELRDAPVIEQNVLLNLPKDLTSDYAPPEYARLNNDEA